MRIVLQPLGWALLVLGLPWMWSPIPLGFVLVAPGLAIVLATNPAARDRLRRARMRRRRLDCALARMERRLPQRIRVVLEATAGPEALAERERWKARAARRRAGKAEGTRPARRRVPPTPGV